MIGFLFLQMYFNVLFFLNFSKSFSFYLYLSLTSFHECLCFLKTRSLRLDRCGWNLWDGPTCLLRRKANSGGPIPSPMHTRPSSVAMLGRRGGCPARGGGRGAAVRAGASAWGVFIRAAMGQRMTAIIPSAVCISQSIRIKHLVTELQFHGPKS